MVHRCLPLSMPSGGKNEAEYRTAAALLALPPYIPTAELPLDLLRRHYGLTGSVSVLASEFERTLGVEETGGRKLIFKLSDRPEARESFRFQSNVLRELENASGLPLPSILDTVDGNVLFAEDGVCGYLQTRIEGTPLHTLQPATELLWQVGASLARLGIALKGAKLLAVDRPVLWQIGSWPWLKELLPYLPAGPTADRVKLALANYLNEVEPRIGELDWQVTHNDPSPFNMFQTDCGVAFIDFGDGGWNPRIQDLVIAASHFVSDPCQPLGGAEPIIAGYHSMRPLTELEMLLFVGMIRARQTALILINHWRAALFPDQAEYIKKNVKRAETGLLILSALDAGAEIRALQSAISQGARCPSTVDQIA